MATESDPFYLGIGSVLSESVTSKLTTSGNRYIGKLLDSKPQNWQKIIKLLRDDGLVGVLAKLTRGDYELMLRPEYQPVVNPLLAAIGEAQHLVLVHEAVAGPPPTDQPEEAAEDEWSEWVKDPYGQEWNDRIARSHFGDIDPAVQQAVHRLLDLNQIAITTYKRNAEASVLASSFIGDLQDHLIFRIYVPAGRMYEDELARLLALFHHWLGAVKGAKVRQGGYNTTHGRVIEFFGEDYASQGHMGTDLAEFNQFLGLIDDPAAASAMLVGLGVPADHVDDLVRRYTRDARRVLLDARHERDRKILTIQQQLEGELLEVGLPVDAAQLTSVVKQLLPSPQLQVGHSSELPALTAHPASPINVTTQVFHHVEGVVAQQIAGHVIYGTPVDDVLRLIQLFGADDRVALQDAAQQLADDQSPSATRLQARQKLKAFLLRNAARVEASLYQVAWAWLEKQITG